MAWKVYFIGMALMVGFSAYYQSITGNLVGWPLVNLVSNIVLLVGGYSYIFGKKVLESNRWKVIFKVLVGILLVDLVYQVLPTSYVGDFSLLNGSLLTNVFVFLLVASIFIPLYSAVYNLGFKSSKKKK